MSALNKLILSLDNYTLLVCIFTISLLFAIAFSRTEQRQNSQQRGSRAFALAFFCSAVSTISIAGTAAIPVSSAPLRFFLTVLNDGLVICVYTLLLDGIQQFFGEENGGRLGWLLTGAAVFALAYFTGIDNSQSARIVIVGAVVAMLRGLFGLVVFLQPYRRHSRSLIVLMLSYAILSLLQAVGTPLHGSPSNFMKSDLVQTTTLYLDLIFVLATGLLLFLLLNEKLVMGFQAEAVRDFVSGTLNRRGIEQLLEAEMERCRRYAEPLAIALIDIDHFKTLNDTLGHAAGDLALAQTAAIIRESLRPYDQVGRYGGDEFLVLLPNTFTEDAQHIVERIQQRMEREHQHTLTLSIGLTPLTPQDDVRTMLARADAALYDAKTDGRNCARMRIASRKDLRVER